MATTIKPIVYVVDDDPAVIRLVEELVKPLGLDVEGYPSAEEFLKAYQSARPGCLVLDVRLAGISGVELQDRLRAGGSTLPIIFVTAYADVAMAVEAMQKGAFGFLEKPFRIQELYDKIQNAVRQDQANWQARRRREATHRRLARLTPAEGKVLELVVAGKTNKMIAQELGISVRTVEVHRARMLKKLAVKTRAELLRLMAAAGE